MADRQLLLIKKEVTPGTDVVPAAADTVWAEGVKFTIQGERKRGRPAKPGSAPIAGHTYGEHVEIEFDVPFAASGAAGTAPKWGPLAKACAWGETIVADTSVTYAELADKSAADSVSIYWNDGRRKHVATFAKGVMTIKAQGGERPMLHFKFRGVMVPVAARAALVAADATWTGWADAKPLAQGRTTFTYAGVTLPLWDLSIDQNDNVVYRDLPGQETVQILGERTFTGKVKAKTPLPSDLNLDTLFQADTVSTFSLVHMVGEAGKIVTLNGRFQQGKPDYADEGGEDVFNADLEFVSSTLATDDEISIVLT